MVNKKDIDVLNEILLRMSYDLGKTLSENRSILNENSKPLPLAYYYYDKNGNLKTLPNLVSNYPAGSTPAQKVYPYITDGSKYPKQRMSGTNLSIQPPNLKSVKTSPLNEPITPPKIDTYRPGSDRIYQPDATYVAPQNLMGGGVDPNKYEGKTKPRPPYICQDVLDSNATRRRTLIWHCLPYVSERATELAKYENFCEKSSCQGNEGYDFLYGIYEEDLDDWHYFHQPPPLSSSMVHTFLDIASIGALFIPVVGPFISLGLELTNAGLYVAEGDEYMAGLSFAFALIPGGELIAKIPAVKKLGRDGLANLLKKSRAGKNLSKTELEVAEQISKNVDEIKKLASISAKTIEKLENLLSNAKFSNIVYMMYKLSKKYPKLSTLSKLTIQIGGVMYGWDKIAEIYGIDDEQSTPQKQKVNQEEFDKYYENNKDEVNIAVINDIMKLDTLESSQLAIDILSNVK